MKLTKCVNGHFYDEEKFESCPHCAGGSKLDVNAIFGGAPSAPKPAMSKVDQDDDMTVPLEWTPEPEPAAAPETPISEPVTAAEPAPIAETEVPAAEAPVSEPEMPVAEPEAIPETETPVSEPEMPVTEAEAIPETEVPAAAPVSEPEMPVTEPEVIPETEVPVSEPEMPAAEPEAIPETETPVTAAELEADFQSQPSFDTPLDFGESIAGEAEKVEEEPFVEPEEEFELLSKFDGDQADSSESDVTIETEPMDMPAEPESFAEPEASAEPEPFVMPEAPAEPETFAEPEAPAEPEPFVMPEAPAEPEPFAEPVASAEPEPFVMPEAPAEPEPFVMPEASAEPESTSFDTPGVTWEMPEPSVEEIPSPSGEPVFSVTDPELEDKPTEILDETDLGPFVTPESVSASTPEPAAIPAEPVPSPAAAMFGASADDDDDEHTVAFYDEIFVSKAPAAPVVPEAAPEEPSLDASLGSDAALSDISAAMPENTENVPEPDVFTAPPLQPAQALPTPCVGWLIALNGVHIGQDFHLRVGKNYIGRDAGMDIALTGDKSVSRNKHAIVIYEPKHHKYFIQPGESNELVYVNDEVVLLPMPLKPYDVIVIGDIELWFMPLCDDQHNWSEVIRRLQEQM